MKKKLLLVSTCFALGAGVASAQSRVTGTVTDPDGNPVIGATVKVDGTRIVTMTDDNGKFSLSNVPASAKHLVVSYIGMDTKTANVSGNVKVVMNYNDTQLSEALVTAYGKQTRESFTGAATQLKGEVIEAKGTTELTKALEGTAAGVTVINTSGQPGTNATVRIRGIGSVNGSSAPLWVVDGIPYDTDMSGINPADVENVTILKDATATALYGSRGANGVIIVTTKRGRSGRFSVEADVDYSISGRWLPMYETITSAERFTELTWEGIRNYAMYNPNNAFGGTLDAATAASVASQYLFSDMGAAYGIGIPSIYNMWNAEGADLIDPETGRFYEGITRKYSPERWRDHLFRTGHKVDAGIRLTGGNEQVQHFTSLGYTKDKGYLIGSDFERFTARSNVNSQLTSWLKASINMSYAHMEYNQPVQDEDASNNAMWFANQIPALYPVYQRDEQGNIVMDGTLGGPAYDYGDATGFGRPFMAGINPAGVANLDVNRNVSNQFSGNGSLEVSFLNDFRFVANLGLNYWTQDAKEVTNPYYGDSRGTGIIYNDNRSTLALTANEILYWGHGYGKHNVNAFVGHESNYQNNRAFYGQKQIMIDGSNADLANGVLMLAMSSYENGYSLDSYFGQVSYNYDEKYFINGSLRGDGSSRFARGNRWGLFGSVGAAWSMNRESWLKDVDWVKDLKLKASWGLIGNQDLALTGDAGYYPYSDMYSIMDIGNGIPAITQYYKGNQDLTWEKTSSFNVGVEFALTDWIEGEVDYFHKKTYDMLFMKTVDPSLGYSSIPVNDGEMTNQGIEFNLTAHLVRQENVKFDFRVNGGWYQNRMKTMPIDPATGAPQTFRISGGYGWKEGHSLYDFYIREYAGVDPQTGEALYNAYYNVAADGTRELITDMETYLADGHEIGRIEVEKTSDWSSATQKYVGKSALPKLQGGFGFDLKLWDFDLTANFTYSIGGYGYDNVYASLMKDNTAGSFNWHKDIENRWQKPGDITDVPRLANGTDTYAAAVSTRFLTKRSYLYLNNLRLSYTFPARLLKPWGAKGLSVYVSGENLFAITARKGYLPMATFSGANDYTDYLPVSNVTFGLKINL